jgi:hypothetical protein
MLGGIRQNTTPVIPITAAFTVFGHLCCVESVTVEDVKRRIGSMNKYTEAMRPGFAFVAVALLSLAPTVASARVVRDSPEFSAFLAQARSEAIQLQQTAEEMNTLKFPQISWQTQADKLEELKIHVNNLGEFVVRMQSVEVPSPSQEQAIRDITPMVEQLAANTTMTIYHLDASRDSYVFSSFPEYVDANAELATNVAQMISDYVAFDEARQKAKEFSDELQRTRWARGDFEY